MTTYIRFKCSICNREIESELDPLRPTLDKCNITYRCEGKLKKVGEKKLRSELVPLPQAGLDSWRQRGAAEVLPLVVKEPVWVTALTGDSCITLALRDDGVIPQPQDITLRLNLLSNSARPFIEYTYSSAALTKIVTGLDVNSKNLRFSNTDEVIVYLNGVRQYDVGPSASYTLDYTSFAVKFNAPFFDASTVKVVVYSALTYTSYDLVAHHNSTTGAWGGVKKLWIDDMRYSVYHANVDDLPVNFYFTVHSVLINNVATDLANVLALLALKPSTNLDRIYGKVLPLSVDVKLNKQMTGDVIDVSVKEDRLIDVYPAIKIVNHQSNMFVLDTTPVLAPGYSLTQNVATSNVVIGPSL